MRPLCCVESRHGVHWETEPCGPSPKLTERFPLLPPHPKHPQNFALKIFNNGDKADRAGRSDKQAAQSLYASSIFLEARAKANDTQRHRNGQETLLTSRNVTPPPLPLMPIPRPPPSPLPQILRQFNGGEIEADLQEKQRYAAWRAADITSALKQARGP